jgi:hypothetical protein
VYFTVDDPSTIEVVSTVAAINSKVGGIREAMLLLPEVLRVISLDAEWDVVCNAAGHVVGSERGSPSSSWATDSVRTSRRVLFSSGCTTRRNFRRG